MERKASKPDYFDVELKHACVALLQTSFLELRDGRQPDVSSTDRVTAAPSVTALNVARKKKLPRSEDWKIDWSVTDDAFRACPATELKREGRTKGGEMRSRKNCRSRPAGPVAGCASRQLGLYVGESTHGSSAAMRVREQGSSPLAHPPGRRAPPFSLPSIQPLPDPPPNTFATVLSENTRDRARTFR